MIGFAAEAEEKDCGEVGVRGVADEDAAEEVRWLTVLGHAAAGAVGDGDDSVDVWVGAEDLWGEVGGDAAGYRGGTVDGGEDADVVAGGDSAVGANDALKGGGGFEECGGVSVGADGVFALEVVGDEVVGVDELAGSDGLRGKADDLIEFAYGFAGGYGTDGELVAGGDISKRNEAGAVEGLPCGNGLERDDNVVQTSEFKGLVAQTIPVLSGISVHQTVDATVVRPHCTPIRWQKDSAACIATKICAKCSIFWG